LIHEIIGIIDNKNIVIILFLLVLKTININFKTFLLFIKNHDKNIHYKFKKLQKKIGKN
jgi:hypothetical protein